MKKTIEVLDCTLRDGGYINDWQFDFKSIREIITKLNTANIEIIEVGFLDDSIVDYSGGTKYKCTKDIDGVLKNINSNAKFVAMIMLGKYPIEKLVPCNNTLLSGIRVCFKKDKMEEAYQYCKQVIGLGYDLYIQPASITDYTEEDVQCLAKLMNLLNSEAVYIVDTYGLMDKEEAVSYFELFDKYFKKDIKIGFHSHNNKQLSFSNSQELLNVPGKRSIIVDSTVFGMGRGAGNLCTELIIQYLNEKHNALYDLIPVLELIENYINPIFQKYSWGYTVPYYLAALTKCHPNYATYLSDKSSVPVNGMKSILMNIDDSKKRNYDEEYIKKLYLEYQENDIDDSKAIRYLEGLICGKDILLIAPGRSTAVCEDNIIQMVNNPNIYSISVNFIPKRIITNMVFFSNKKRYMNTDIADISNSVNLAVTSNIVKDENIDALIFNYNRMIDNCNLEIDNSGIMLIRMLSSINVRKVFLAGFDGFTLSNSQNVEEKNYVYNTVEPDIYEKRNKDITKQFNQLKKIIEISFITPSLYDLCN